MNWDTRSVASAFISGPAMSWFWTRGRNTEPNSAEYGGWIILRTCNNSRSSTRQEKSSRATVLIYLRYKVSYKWMVQVFSLHTPVHVVHHLETRMLSCSQAGNLTKVSHSGSHTQYEEEPRRTVIAVAAVVPSLQLQQHSGSHVDSNAPASGSAYIG